MALFKNFGTFIMEFVNAIKSERLRWRLEKQEEITLLKQSRTLADWELEARLRRERVRLEHEIALLKTENETELEMLRAKCRQEIRDYRQYLDSLDRLKVRVQKKYKHLPDSVAFTIHHHAKQLLNQMWETEEIGEKLNHEMKLLHFMTAVHEDTREPPLNPARQEMPTRTLELIGRD